MSADLKAITWGVKRAVNVVKSHLTDVIMVAEAVKTGATDQAEGKRTARQHLNYARNAMIRAELAIAALDESDPTPPSTAAAQAPDADTERERMRRLPILRFFTLSGWLALAVLAVVAAAAIILTHLFT